MRRARWLATAVLLSAAACVHRPLPLPMAPVRAITLAQPVSGEILAVLDFTDERPPFERGPAEIDEMDVGGRYFADDRFFSFHAEEATLPADPAAPPDLRARVTGAAAFAWYPFPNPGIGRPVIQRIEVGLPDYVALHLEQRGIFAKVIRARDEEAARAAGATLLMSGRVDRFGALFAESRDPYVVRPDDWVEFRLLAAVNFTVTLGTLLTRECAGRDEETALFDRLSPYRGAQGRPLYQLDAEDFPSFALEDLATRTRRALERATLPLVAAIEGAVTPPPPPAETPAAPAAPSGP